MKNKNKLINILFILLVLFVLGFFIQKNFFQKPIPKNQLLELSKKGNGKNELKVVLEYGCHFARDYYLETIYPNENKLLQNNIHIIYDLISLNYTEPSFPAVKAVYCANEQNKFFELNNIFFNQASNADTIKDVFTEENIINLSKQVKMNQDQFQECFLSDKYDEYIYNHSREYISNLKEDERFGFPSTYLNQEILTINLNAQQLPLGYTSFDELNNIIQTKLK
ncbi:MAG: thioredoxin domain-containing protein [Candidatus Pacebacteria bacterium]|nr:thioredoxin domain-containing protein [Candidatus Paceibacterota bacterium]